VKRVHHSIKKAGYTVRVKSARPGVKSFWVRENEKNYVLWGYQGVHN
jgi:hypothetical protein